MTDGADALVCRTVSLRMARVTHRMRETMRRIDMTGGMKLSWNFINDERTISFGI
ncbi:hypothetical protein [Sphingomonas sp. GB1N7]|uniref:hypothetical protein n=1 Tax=Parasphingomonas caseinilytica TaxID=3096158 RepID=UPI002FC8EF70